MPFLKAGPILPRRTGLFPVVLSILLGCASVAGGAQNAAVPDSGVFSIVASQRQVGTEKFKISPVASGFEATGELQIDMPGSPRVVETCFLRLDAKLQPTSYERQQKSPKKGTIFAQFGSSQTKLTSKTVSGDNDQLFYLSNNHLVILDTNFFHHYALLLRQYDSSQPGPQHFNVFVPQEATPGTISLELRGKESQTIGKASLELNHFLAVTDQVSIDIWAGQQGEIYRISIPQANLEFLRQ